MKRNAKRLYLALALALSTLTLPLAAQTRAQRQGPPMDDIKTYLKLSDQQVAQLEQIRTAEREANRARVEEIRTKQRQLRETLNSPGADANTAGRLLVEIQTAQREIRNSHEQYRNQAAAVLTPEQKTRLAALEEAAKLAPAIRQAALLNLMALPDRDRMGPEGRLDRPMPMMAPPGGMRGPRGGWDPAAHHFGRRPVE